MSLAENKLLCRFYGNEQEHIFMKIYESSIPLSHYTIFLTNVKGNFSIKFVENLHKMRFVEYLYKKYSSNITIFTKENS